MMWSSPPISSTRAKQNSSGSGQGRAGEYGRASSNRPPFSRRRAREKVSSQRALGKRTGAPRRQTA